MIECLISYEINGYIRSGTTEKHKDKFCGTKHYSSMRWMISKQHELGKHPFNILTEEIYND